MRLLWVENHAGFVRIAGKQFLSAHELTVAPSLAAARDALRAGAFDAVLLDYDLDDGKGTDLIALIRESHPVTVVVAVSSHEDGNAALLAAGADGVCSKGKFAGIESVLASVCASKLRTITEK